MPAAAAPSSSSSSLPAKFNPIVQLFARRRDGLHSSALPLPLLSLLLAPTSPRDAARTEAPHFHFHATEWDASFFPERRAASADFRARASARFGRPDSWPREAAPAPAPAARLTQLN